MFWDGETWFRGRGCMETSQWKWVYALGEKLVKLVSDVPSGFRTHVSKPWAWPSWPVSLTCRETGEGFTIFTQSFYP